MLVQKLSVNSHLFVKMQHGFDQGSLFTISASVRIALMC